MAKKAATPATITLKHLAASIAEDQELSKKQAETILNDLVNRITKHLKKGERIRIVGLGILQVRKRAARMSLWVREGKVKYKEFVTEGLDSAPDAFMSRRGARFFRFFPCVKT